MTAAALSLPEQFDHFSAAYLDSARVLCRYLVEHPDLLTWPRAAACMAEARHAVELFLKGAILQGAPDEQLGMHSLAMLHDKYIEVYPQSRFRFDVPFRTQVVGASGAEVAAIIKKHDKANPIDQRFRYPANREFEPWPGIDSCDPDTFLTVIGKLEEDFARVRPLIFSGATPKSTAAPGTAAAP